MLEKMVHALRLSALIMSSINIIVVSLLLAYSVLNFNIPNNFLRLMFIGGLSSWANNYMVEASRFQNKTLEDKKV